MRQFWARGVQVFSRDEGTTYDRVVNASDQLWCLAVDAAHAAAIAAGLTAAELLAEEKKIKPVAPRPRTGVIRDHV